MPFVEPTAPPGFENFGAGAAATHPVVSFRARETGRRLVAALAGNTHGGFPVCGDSGELIGFVLRARIVTLLTAPAADFDASGTLPLSAFHTAFDSRAAAVAEGDVAVERLNGEHDLSMYADGSPLSVPINYPLTKVHVLFRSLGLRHLCVVHANNALHGLITRKDLLITTFNQDKADDDDHDAKGGEQGQGASDVTGSAI